MMIFIINFHAFNITSVWKGWKGSFVLVLYAY